MDATCISTTVGGGYSTKTVKFNFNLQSLNDNYVNNNYVNDKLKSSPPNKIIYEDLRKFACRFKKNPVTKITVQHDDKTKLKKGIFIKKPKPVKVIYQKGW